MKRLFSRLFLACSLLTVSACGPSASAKLVGQPAPPARIIMMDGSEVGLINLQGKKVVLLFWAAWCSASRPVHEDLNDLARKYGGRRDVEFIAVSIDKAEDLQKLQDRIRAGKFFDVKQAFSGNEHLDEAYRAFRVDTLPTVFFIDENGTVVEYGHSAGFVEDLLRR